MDIPSNHNLSELKKILGVDFKDEKILFEALTHRSYLNETPNKGLSSNERLEFLGDSVLSFWVSNKIFCLFPDLPEGKLTFIRTYLVRTTTLTVLAQKLSLGDFLLMSKGEEMGGGRENVALMANSFEAVLGAIFFDSGFAVAEKFLEKNFAELLTNLSDPDQLKDSKSILQEKVQAKGSFSPVYKLVTSTGPDHKKIFTMAVFVDEKQIAEGTSKSKQEAEELAAKNALEIL